VRKTAHSGHVVRVEGMHKHITKLFAALLLASVATGCVVHDNTPARRTVFVHRR